MGEMTKEDYEQLIKLLDGRIDKLTNPIPSKQILRFAEAIRSADLGSEDSVGTYTEADYGNLLEAYDVVVELLPPIMENIRVHSIDRDSGWKLADIDAGQGDIGLCAICRKPFQHFGSSVQVHHLDSHPNAFHGVCRECVRQYAPVAFIEQSDVDAWLNMKHGAIHRDGVDRKQEEQRIDLIDAIRRYTSADRFYFTNVSAKTSEWSSGAYGEWR